MTEYAYPVAIHSRAANVKVMLIGGIDGKPTGFDTAQLYGAC